MATDAQGNVYVTYVRQGRVQKFAPATVAPAVVQTSLRKGATGVGRAASVTTTEGRK